MGIPLAVLFSLFVTRGLCACEWVFGGPRDANSCTSCDGLGRKLEVQTIPPGGSGNTGGTGGSPSGGSPTGGAPGVPGGTSGNPSGGLVGGDTGASGGMNQNRANAPLGGGEGDSNLGIILGAVGGGLCCCALVLFVLILLNKKKKKNNVSHNAEPAGVHMPTYGNTRDINVGQYGSAATLVAGSQGGTMTSFSSTGTYQEVPRGQNGYPQEVGGMYGSLNQKSDLMQDNTIYGAETAKPETGIYSPGISGAYNGPTAQVYGLGHEPGY